jgi:hypothetical protein
MARTRLHPFCGLQHFSCGSRRLSALCVALGFLTFLAVSSPHRVHHLVERYASSDHQPHESQAQTFPDCPVFSLTQQTVCVESHAQPVLTPLSLGERLWPVPPRHLPENFWERFQTRSPPSWSLLGSLASSYIL